MQIRMAIIIIRARPASGFSLFVISNGIRVCGKKTDIITFLFVWEEEINICRDDFSYLSFKMQHPKTMLKMLRGL